MSQTFTPSKSAVRAPRRDIGFLIFPGFDLLQLSGPLQAFRLAGEDGPGVMSLDGGQVPSAAGLTVMTQPVTADRLDTLVIVGGATQNIPRLAELADFACAAAAVLRRIAAIGSGIFVLAEAGLLNGRQAAVAPEFAPEFARAYPQARRNGGRSFVEDRGLWTAPDASAGIELCLALNEDDWGAEICRAIAPSLPVDPGKSQYAAPPDLSPAEADERLRAEAALQLVQEGCLSFEAIARGAGFKDAQEMRLEFLRQFGQPPQVLRRAARAARKLRARRAHVWPSAKRWSDLPKTA